MEAISTSDAPAETAPYSRVIAHGGLLFVSDQLPIDPQAGAFSSDDPLEQTRQCLINIAAIAKAAGTDMKNCLKTTVLVNVLLQFGRINEIYATFFPQRFPARVTSEGSSLLKDAQVEIDAVFALPSTPWEA